MARMSPVEPLVEEAMKKAAIAWVSAAGHEQVAVWCLWHEGALFVVSGPGEQPAARWAAECVVSRLTPAGGVAEAGATLPDGSLATPPRPTPAVRLSRRPFRLHRVRRP